MFNFKKLHGVCFFIQPSMVCDHSGNSVWCAYCTHKCIRKSKGGQKKTKVVVSDSSKKDKTSKR